MTFKFDSLDTKYRNPFGAVRNGDVINLFVESDADKVWVNGFGRKMEMDKQNDGFHFEHKIDIDKGLILFEFEAQFGKKKAKYSKGKFGKSCEYGEKYQITVHNNKPVPDWFKNSVMYQIYVDRFFKGDDSECKLRDNVLIHSSWNDMPLYIRKETGEIASWDFFGGNIDGVIQKLDYLEQLGVNIIYLNPIFEASSNHKYDTADYKKVDRMYGNEDTLKRLVDLADKRGMKIMLDGVFSHTGDDSIYFNRFKTYGEKTGAYNDVNSPYYSWYKFEKYPENYDCWWGVKALPCVDELNPCFMDYLLNYEHGAVTKWMKLGIAGWRLDVADELPDKFIKELKKCVLNANPDAVLLGEVWEDASNKVSYDKGREYILGDALDSVSNYPLRDNLIKVLRNKIGPSDFGDIMMSIFENYPDDIANSLMNMTSTHDTDRLFTTLGFGGERDEMDTWQQRGFRLNDNMKRIAMDRMYLFFLIIYMLPGNPCIYYGDEIFTQGFKDPYNRATFDWQADMGFCENIKEFRMLRENIGVANSKIEFCDTNDYLAYKIVSGKGTYFMCINPYDIDIAINIDYNEMVFGHKVDNTWHEGTYIKSCGAVLLQL